MRIYLFIYFVICIRRTLTWNGSPDCGFSPCVSAPSFCLRALLRLHVEKCRECFSGGGCTFREVAFQRGQTSIHPSERSMSKTTWATSCSYLLSLPPPTKIYLWQVFLSFSPGIGLCLLGRDVKHHYNVLVSDRGRRPSPNLPLIFGVTGLCLSETSLRDGGPGWSTAPNSCDHQYSLIFTLSLCSSRTPFAQRFSNIHCHQENKYFHPRACRDEEVTFLCRFKKLWMALAVSLSPSLEISHKGVCVCQTFCSVVCSSASSGCVSG